MKYEVEERVNKDLKNRLPKEVELRRIFSYICDTYFHFPNPMVRVRYGKISFPTIKQVASICMKKVDSERNIKEFETSVGDPKCAIEIFLDMIGKPMVVVEGSREEYSFGNATICIDNIKDLGNWTEVEVMASSLEEKTKALEQIRQIFSTLGVRKEELTNETYPEMFYRIAQADSVKLNNDRF